MQVIETGPELAATIHRFESHGASSVHLGTGTGDAHVYAIHIEPGGEIGPHEAGFDQLFIVVEGAGWAAGADGVQIPLDSGRAVIVHRGEIHSKGSETGMKAIMVQVSALRPPEDAPT